MAIGRQKRFSTLKLAMRRRLPAVLATTSLEKSGNGMGRPLWSDDAAVPGNHAPADAASSSVISALAASVVADVQQQRLIASV
jgi:hypothetical protein